MVDQAASMALIIVGLLLSVMLLRILFVVHHQVSRIKELETRMKSTEEMEATDSNG